MKKVLLLKAVKGSIEDDSYVKQLKSKSFSPTLIEVLSFSFTNLDKLYNQISNPDNYGGIIFSSPRTVEAFEKAIESESTLEEWRNNFLPKWRNLPAYTVGKATGDFVKDLGLVPIGADSGNAENLVKYIVKGSSPGGRPLVFPCGNLRRETIPSSLNDIGILYESTMVYETIAHPKLEESIKNYIENEGIPDSMVFFSPSGVRYSSNAISTYISISEVELIAIGQTTKEAMEKAGYMVSAVAENPSPDSLLKIL